MTIKKLILLDFYTIKPLLHIMLMFLIIPVILGIVVDPGTSIMVTMTFIVFMLNVVFSIAEKSNFNKLYGILPIQRSHSIISRYLFSLIILGITAGISFLIYLILSYIESGNMHMVNGIGYLILSSMISIFFISIQYPFYFKFEYSKATIMSILPYILVFAIGSPLLSYLMENITFYQTVTNLISYFQTHILQFLALGLTVCISMLGCSYCFSKIVYKKEF